MPAATDIEQIIDKYPGTSEHLIFLLQDIQESFGFISQENMQAICDHTGVPLTRAYSVTTFYQSFRLDPKGDHEIQVCEGTACHLKGGPRIVDELERRLKVHMGETTQDMRFTLNSVRCVGACALAPVVAVDEEFAPKVTAKKLDKIFKQIDQEDAV